MRFVKCLLVTSALLLPAATRAAPDPPSTPGEVRLSDAEKEKVLEAAAARNRQTAEHGTIDQLREDPLPPPVHGEVGFSIGTGGYRSIHGIADIPLKNDGFAIISFESTDFGSRSRDLKLWRN